MRVNIHRATLDDLEDLVALFDGYRVFYSQKSDLEAARVFLRERLAQDQSVIFLATAGGKPAGFTQLFPSFSSVSLKRLWILNDLFVAKAFRRHGTGGLLLDQAAAFAKEKGAKGLVLQTARDNTTAQKLYVAKGWQRDDLSYYYELYVNS